MIDYRDLTGLARTAAYREQYLNEKNKLDRNPAIDSDDLTKCPEGLPVVIRKNA